MTRSLILAVAICTAGAALEGVAAGGGVRRRLMALRMPPYSPPLVLWIVIGVMFYGVCFVVAYRLLLGGLTPAQSVALALQLGLMAANVAWNYLFFRRRSHWASAAFLVPYGVLAVVLLVLLGRVDTVAFWAFLLYVVYLPYAAWWLIALRHLNENGPFNTRASGELK